MKKIYHINSNLYNYDSKEDHNDYRNYFYYEKYDRDNPMLLNKDTSVIEQRVRSIMMALFATLRR